MKTKTIAPTHDDLNARLIELKKQAAQLEKQLARGTSDVTEQARAATKHPRVGGDLSLSLPERIENALRTKPHSLEELAKELKEPVGKISAAVKPMRERLYNVGSEHAPAWFWIVGDKASATEINAAVEALVSYREMTLPELLAATGGRQSRVSGGIIRMQRDPKYRIVNLGDERKAKWRVLPEGVQLSRLEKPR